MCLALGLSCNVGIDFKWFYYMNKVYMWILGLRKISYIYKLSLYMNHNLYTNTCIYKLSCIYKLGFVRILMQ